MPGDDTPREGVVLSRAGKASSSKKNWYNVEYRKPEDLKAELENWKRHHVYQEVEDYGQSYVSTRWVYTIKEADNEIHRKARLVAKGFEEDCLDEIQKNSPTCDKQSLRLILSIIMQKKWSINSIDIKTAFLQGEKMQRKVHLRPPKEANANGKLWLLEKCVYGLADASLKWYEKVKKTLNECGGTNLFETEIISKIREKFSVGKEASESFKYLGLGLSHADDKIILSQTDYVEVLKTISIDRKRPNDSQLSSVEQTVLRSKVGQLLWLAKQTRPDIAFDIAMIASKLKTSTIEDFKRVNKLLRKVRNDPVSLHFKELGELYNILMLLLEIFLMGAVKEEIRSTLASEALALADGIDCATSLATLYNELVFNKCTTEGGITVRCVIDNKDLFEAVHSKKNVSEKRLRLEISCIKEMIQKES
ncbi:unnamed protein product [Mytilus edulis]|uniref:Reverse transcriptase Ty1/copia-type domain-containing protein n=1 Tax=Mytilus edulis TaxID=6550 RepID=A0A8S3SAI7_MYTED|nr:unnamed protein product [Mytilus edulis]